MQERLIILRKKKNVTQRQLADLLGISVKAYGFKELGKTEFTMNEMFLIAKYFSKNIDEIFLPSLLQNGVNKKEEV